MSLSNQKTLHGITASAFQHPLDRRATEQLAKIRYFDKIVAKFIELGIERFEYVVNTASNVRVGPKQFPKIYDMLQTACTILDMEEPELYVSQGPLNAYTYGHNNPCIVVMTDLLDRMDDDEVMAVIAHELGHIKCGHVLYKQMARHIGGIVEIAGNVVPGVGTAVGIALQSALVTWDRRSELSADRASLLVMQEARPCITMLMKLAAGTVRLADQMDPKEFLKQARVYGEDMERNLGDRFFKFWVNLSKGTHPFAVERAKALDEWIVSPEYKQILAGNYPSKASPVVDTRNEPQASQPQPSISDQLRQVQKLKDENLITQAEYEQKRKEILDRLG